MSNTSPKTQDRAFTMRADGTFFDDLDELRSLLQPVPTKSDAIRYAVRKAVSDLRATPRRVETLVE